MSFLGTNTSFIHYTYTIEKISEIVYVRASKHVYITYTDVPNLNRMNTQTHKIPKMPYSQTVGVSPLPISLSRSN